MSDKRPSSTKVRRDCFEAHKKTDEDGHLYLVCYLSGGRFNPSTTAWEAEHVIRRVLKKDDTPSNVWPAHARCHKPKTATDITENAKGKRVADKSFGVKRKSGFSKTWRKKMDGSVVRRGE